MVHFLIILALSIGLIAALGGWSRDRRLLSESRKRSQDRDAEGTSALEKANKDLKASQADLQRRWQYLAEAQRLSHSGTFGWKVHTGELVWSDCPAAFAPPTTMTSFAATHLRLNKSCAIINARTFKARQILNRQLPVFGPGGDDDCTRWDPCPIFEFYLIRLAVAG
jgi:hypothetical protein